MLNSDTPRLSAWPFLISDVILLGTAALIAQSHAGPLQGGALLAVVSCVGLGAVVAIYPFVANFTRRQEEALDERQRALENLAQKVASAAEQVGIATNGINELIEVAERHLHQAEHLPQKLQEKIAEFNQQLANARSDEQEELEREVATLRTAEGDRLEAAAEKTHRAMVEWAKLEAAADQHLSAAVAALARAEKIGEASAATIQQAAEKAAAAATAGIGAELERAVFAARQAAEGTLEQATARGAQELEQKAAATFAAWDERVAEALRAWDQRIDKLDTILARSATAVMVPPAPTEVETVPAPLVTNEVAPAVAGEAPIVEAGLASVEPMESAAPITAAPTKRGRKSRRENGTSAAVPAAETPKEEVPPSAERAEQGDPVALPVAANDPLSSIETPTLPPPESPLPVDRSEQTPEAAPEAPVASAVEAVAEEDLPPVASEALPPASLAEPAAEAETVSQIAPVVAAESADLASPGAAPATPPAAPSEEGAATEAPLMSRAARRKAAKQAEDDQQPGLGLVIEEPARNEFSQESPEEGRFSTSVSADGATRLLVTAYIGIGNRLYIRGEGPGLSAERGLPLQFVSIGKWRWETADATAPVRIKLLKNDQLECPSLGEIMLDPGHQAEVTANF